MATAPTVRFEAKLLRPAGEPRATWTFLLLPKAASAKMPSRGMTTVEGRLNGKAFRANLEPDGNKGHWLKVPRTLATAAGAKPGDVVAVELAPSSEQLELPLPADLKKALAAAPAAARASWEATTPAARRDWVQWIISARTPETRARRIANACDMLAGGKKRVCCFDRSGFYSKEFSAPEAAP